MSDGLIAPIWLGATLLLAVAAWIIGRRIFPNDGFVACLMHSLVLSWACVVGVATCLGSIGVLKPVFLMIGVAASAGMALWFCRQGNRHIVSPPRLFPISQEKHLSLGSRRIDYLFLVLWGFGLSWALGRILLRGLLMFPGDWDTLNYHLPLIVQWLRQGSLYVPLEPIWFAPGNNELVGLWVVGPFSGDFLFSLLNLPGTLLLAVGTIELVRNLGLPRPWDYLIALALLATGPVLRQITDAENDVAVNGLFIAVVAYGARFARKETKTNLILGAISLGLLAGVKYYALGYALLAGTGWLLLIFLTHGWKVAFRYGLVLVVGFCLWGGYWYARNYWVGGSPIYPQGLTTATDKLGQIRGSAGQTQVWQTTLLGNGRPEVFPLLERALWRWTGPCHAVAFYLLPLAIIWLSASGIWWLQRDRSAGAIRLTLVFWVLAAGAVWGVTPFAVEVVAGSFDSIQGGYHPIRYGLCFLSLCVICLSLVFHDFIQMAGNWRRTIWLISPRTLLNFGLLAFALGAVVYQLTVRLQSVRIREGLDLLLLTTMFWLTGVNVFIAWITWPRWRRVFKVAFAGIFVVGGAFGIEYLAEKWHEGFARFYDIRHGDQLFSDLEKMDPAATRICTMAYAYYPYFGSRRQFFVCRPYWLPTYPLMLDYLRENDITFIVALQEDALGVGRYQGKSDWLRAHKDLFSMIKDGPLHYVCRVNSDLLKSASSR